jgi:hypothetical protein
MTETGLLTIANLDLRRGVPLGDILDASYDFRHCECGQRGGNAGGAGSIGQRAQVGRPKVMGFAGAVRAAVNTSTG